MSATTSSFPPDWLERGMDHPATDLDLAVLLVNSHDLLDEPADRLGDLTWLTEALTRVGHRDLAAALTRSDLPRLRSLRSLLRSAFEARDLKTAADVLNPQLVKARAVLLLDVTSRPAGARFVARPDLTGYAALAARLPSALAGHLAEHGVGRLGICSSDPCRCAFVDRTRAGTRRYCCTVCNDRYAARAYRRRRRGAGT